MAMKPSGDGPNLQTYVETRFNLLGQEVHGLKALMDSAFKESDLRYQQRFDAQAKALEAAFQAAKEAVQAALSAADRAVSKAELAADKRFESVNEFRKTLDDQQRTLMPRAESDRAMQALAEKLVSLKEQMDALLAERAGVKGGWGYAVGVVGFLLALGSLGVLIFKMVTP
jgi:hypothetical protein